MRKVEVRSYDSDWGVQFFEEAERLKTVFGDELLAVHHIGSTAVPGLSAKPVIDLMPVVRDIAQVDQFNGAMQALGYEPKGENGLPGRRYFQKGGDARTHHVHVYQDGNFEIVRHLAFRDYLREHPEARAAYSAVKEQLAHAFPHDIEAYIKGKNDIVKELERKALLWREECV